MKYETGKTCGEYWMEIRFMYKLLLKRQKNSQVRVSMTMTDRPNTFSLFCKKEDYC